VSSRRSTHPQIPVDFTPTVTSPGLSVLPDLTSSSEGSAFAIQSSCFGLVKTPIFGLEGVTVIVDDMVGCAILGKVRGQLAQSEQTAVEAKGRKAGLEL
jgi:hypothetical protein